MNPATLRRLMNESTQIDKQKKEDSGMFEIRRVGEDMYHWEATLYGPKDSLYQGYQFEVDIQLPANYPTSPMTVKFSTKIQHANVNNNGDICLDILKNQWVSTLNIRTVLISLISLLSDPNLDDPLNSELAELYRTNTKEYEKRIRDACKKFANPMN